MRLPTIDSRPDLYDEAERWSLDELQARQLERLQDTVRRAYVHVPHYAQALRELFDLDHAHVATVTSPPRRGGAGDLE